MSNIYAIGDIHGQLDMLRVLIEKINPDKEDLLIFTGDYIDRGKDSKGVIDFLIQLSKERKCIFLKGNHEEVMMSYMSGRNPVDFQLWKQIGGNKTIKSYKGSISNIPQSHRAFLQNLKLHYETEKYFFVHAGIDPNKKIENHLDSDFMWIRDEFILHPTNFSKKVVYGHTAEMFVKPIHDDKICIDGGVAYGGPLIAIKLPEETIIRMEHGNGHY